MPGLNHKGPKGDGPMTGRKMGKCTNYGAGKKNPDEETDRGNSTTFNEVRGMGSFARRGMCLGRKNRKRNSN
jgi:hypothetical protein